MQCASGSFSGSGASECTACSAGKYLSNVAGGTEAASCTAVSIPVWRTLTDFVLGNEMVCYVCSVPADHSLVVERRSARLAPLAST